MTTDATEAGSRPLNNSRWESFCIAYTGQHKRNGSAAYVAAGYKPKASQTAASMAERLLRNDDIQARIEYLNNEALKIERLHARDAIARLATIATAKLSDFLDEAGNVNIDMVKNHPLSAAIQEFTSEDTPNGRKVRIKLKDDMRALELLGLTDKASETTQTSCFIIEV
jgi:phage terminase small subunit